MIYLLTLGWPWFAGAFALGALVGFLTFKATSAATFSGGWVVVAGALALAAGFAVSGLELLAGRDAAHLDIALLAGLAYAAGLPLGGLVKSLGGPATEIGHVVRAPLVVAPVRIDAREATPASVTAAVAGEQADSQPRAEALTPAPPQPVASPARKATPGVSPSTLAAPRNSAPDDLSRIKGIGPKSVEKLHALGVFHYDQIAAWNLDNAKWIGAAIGAPGRVERDKWIQQARAITGAGTERR